MNASTLIQKLERLESALPTLKDNNDNLGFFQCILLLTRQWGGLSSMAKQYPAVADMLSSKISGSFSFSTSGLTRSDPPLNWLTHIFPTCSTYRTKLKLENDKLYSLKSTQSMSFYTYRTTSLTIL